MNITEDQVEIVAQHLHALGWSIGGDYTEDFKPDVRAALEHLATRPHSPDAADSGRVGDEAAYRYNAPSWQEISAAEGDAIAALKVLHHAGSLINAQLPGTAQLCAKWPSLIGTIKAALAAQGQGDAVAWLHTVTQGDGETDQALSFSPDSFPLDTQLGFRSLGSVPLYTHPAPAASPAGVPDGMALVPREATEAMLQAAAFAVAGKSGGKFGAMAGACYRAMIAATAPRPLRHGTAAPTSPSQRRR